MASTSSSSISAAALADPAGWAAGLPLARKAVVDTRRAVIGYALSHDAAANDDTRLFETLQNARADSATATRLAFVRCSFEHMADGYLRMLDPQRTVLEIASLKRHTPEGIAIRRSMLLHAHQSGFKLAFDHAVLAPEYELWLPLATYVAIDVESLDERAVEKLARNVFGRTKATALARNVGSAGQYEHLKSVGVKLFAGHWFAEPPTAQDKAIQTSQASVVQLLNLVLREAEVGEIEEVLKRDPTLSFKLLHFINSPGFGLNVEISSFRHAVMTLGLSNLFRWAVLLLTTSRPGGPAPGAGTLALVRGRLMELLAETLPREERDLAFIAGVFSMLDTLLGMPLDKALQLVNLPASVADAVVRHTGPLAPYLAIAEACETSDDAGVNAARKLLGLTNHQINSAQLSALAWVDRVDQ
ncbi:MAG: HDOD domain-containing protein [Burkholderiaceae bacterium]